MISKLSIITLLGMLLLAAPASALPDLSVTAVDAYHTGDFGTYASPWISISNEVDVTVYNGGDADGSFHVSLYANETFIDKLAVSNLGAGSSTTLKFNWVPDGCDCDDGCEPVVYAVKAIADCDGEVAESDENNNEFSVTETAIYNGYTGDEPLENIASGRLNGGLIYTTGNSAYTGLYTNGASMSGQYDIVIPDSATVELARLNVYYCWAKPEQYRPEMEVSITNQAGTHILTADRYYDDRKGWGSWDMYWGNWVYDVAPYIQGSGTYSVTVKNIHATGSVCPAGPGIVILYSDETMPPIDYWINEGADAVEVKNGYLLKSEAINNASFDGQVHGKVVSASLGLVNPWANSDPYGSEVFFNGLSMGQDVYGGGYGHPQYCSMSMNAIDMEANVNDAYSQVAISLLDVKDRLNVDGNYAGMGDISDVGALPANAFLVVEYEWAPTPLLISGLVSDIGGNPANNPSVVITNLMTGGVLGVETASGSNYYQTMTSSYGVCAGDVLNFDVVNGNPAEVDHTVTTEEMNAGALELDLTVQPIGQCGDVTGNNVVNTGDVILLSNYVGYQGYTLVNEWAGDVTGNGVINTGDVILLSNYVGYQGYSLNCTV
ncbi:MAG TPA: DUF3344 domain-containing protein [Methanosarcinaceae archaeon]|nr:DUF3344 domain-containing protein [Methanosarcinaceae archaeon]